MDVSLLGKILWRILAYIESALGWLLSNFKGRDQGLFTRLPIFNHVPSVVRVTSDLGASGRAILPIQFTAAGGNLGIFPRIVWGNLPAATREVLVVVQDPDVPLPRPILHCAFYGIPASVHDLSADDVPLPRNPPSHLKSNKLQAGRTITGETYIAPRPILSHGQHRYVFQVIALAESIRDVWSSPPSLSQIAEAVEGRIVGWGEWVGLYERRLRGALLDI